jgi:hypothetical protein
VTTSADLGHVAARTRAFVASLEAGDVDADELLAFLAERQDLVAGLQAAIDPVTTDRRSAAELAALDQRLHAWCAERQREIAQRLARARAEARRDRAPTPRLVSQEI